MCEKRGFITPENERQPSKVPLKIDWLNSSGSYLLVDVVGVYRRGVKHSSPSSIELAPDDLGREKGGRMAVRQVLGVGVGEALGEAAGDRLARHEESWHNHPPRSSRSR